VLGLGRVALATVGQSRNRWHGCRNRRARRHRLKEKVICWPSTTPLFPTTSHSVPTAIREIQLRGDTSWSILTIIDSAIKALLFTRRFPPSYMSAYNRPRSTIPAPTSCWIQKKKQDQPRLAMVTTLFVTGRRKITSKVVHTPSSNYNLAHGSFSPSSRRKYCSLLWPHLAGCTLRDVSGQYLRR
jgi:hypothetical protein